MIRFCPSRFPAVHAKESHSCLRWRSPDLERGRDASGDGRAASRFGRQFWPGCSRIGAIRRGSCTAWSICSAPACSRSAAATRTPTTSIICGPIRRSSSPAVACRTRAGTCVPKPTLSRLENSPRLRDVIRLTYTLVDAWMDSYPCEPASVTLDIDDTCDVVHGHQQLSLFNAHYDERCFLPIHVYDTEKSRPRGGRAAARQDAGRRRRCVPIFDAWYGTSARDGTRRELRSAATGIMPGRRR